MKNDPRNAIGKRCFVYFNLHKRCFSVKALEGPNKGRVVFHANAVYMQGCVFKVSEAGRRRVLRDKQKNVHAGVVGVVRYFPRSEGEFDAFKMKSEDFTGVKYNPYKYRSFVKADNPAVPVYSADMCWLDANKRTIGAINPNYEVTD